MNGNIYSVKKAHNQNEIKCPRYEIDMGDKDTINIKM